MKQDIIKKALEKVHAKKRQAEQEYNNKMKTLYSDPTFEELNKSYTRTMIENSRLEAIGEKPNNEKEADLKSEIDKLKEKHGLENIQVFYACPHCEDNGYINGDMCKCLKKEISSLLLQDSGFDKLENFEEGIKNIDGNLKQIYLKMQEWCNGNFTKSLIYLAGPTGVGKTYLVECMANELIERGKVIRLVTAFKMNQDFVAFRKTKNDELLNKYIDCEILFIDDLGTEPVYKDATLECLYLIINERKMKKLPTVITSNLTLEDIIERYDERIFSRIVDRKNSITLLINGEDKRLK